MSSKKGSFDCYHLKHIIQAGDIIGVIVYIQGNNLTPAHYKNCTDTEHLFDIEAHFPVMVAARCGQVNILNYLVSRGFSHKFGLGSTPLLEACKHGHILVVKALVEIHGVDVSEIYFPISDCWTCETALTTAVLTGHLEIVQYLLEKGASVKPAYNQRESTPLHAAVVGQNVGIVKILSQYIDVDITVQSAPGYVTPLTLAVSRKNGDILTALLDAGADVEGRPGADYSPFGRAVWFRELEHAKLLYSKGANPERRNSHHLTPLEIAILRDHYDMVRYLVVELNLPWDDNKSPIEMALVCDPPSFIKLLLDAGFSYWINTTERQKKLSDMTIYQHEACVYLEEFSSNSRTLKQICCFKVRRLLGRNLSRLVDTIPLPSSLIDFVKLTHIPEHMYT